MVVSLVICLSEVIAMACGSACSVSVRGLVRCLLSKKNGSATIALWKKILSRSPVDIEGHRRRAAEHYDKLRDSFQQEQRR